MTARRMVKRDRLHLAKAELLVFLAITALRWQRDFEDANPGVLPMSEWPADDPFVTLCRTYRLSQADLAKLCDRLSGELEGRAIRAGYDEHIDPVEDDS